MKVVLFCGGFGTRLREYSDTIPKSMVSIGPRPIIWHLMKYYAHSGHTEFILWLTDLSLPAYLEHFRSHDKVASFLCVRPAHSFHVVSLGNGGDVLDLRDATESDLWINGGFFAFKHRIFEYIKDGEELVCEPFQRLIRDNELVAYQYTGF